MTTEVLEIDNLLEIKEIIGDKSEVLLVFPGTLKDFYNLGEIKADFIQGLIYVQMSASIKHEEIFVFLLMKLSQLINSAKSGKVLGSRASNAIDPNYHPEPDIMFVSKENKGKFDKTKFHGVPDLVIEIISKSTRSHDLETKRPLYQKYKVPEIWMIDYLFETVWVDYLENDFYQSEEKQKTGKLSSKILEGFVLELEEVFAV